MDRKLASLVLVLSWGCSAAEPSSPSEPLDCDGGLEPFEGRCVDPAARYEPDERLDDDNVVSFTGEPTHLDLPDPPKAGFRLIMPPVELAPGEEQLFCVSWPFPEQHRDLVYAAKIYATGGLHHSNVFSPATDPELGPNPHPQCHPGADDAFAAIGEGVPDVLFANSTQVAGGETLVFPPGMGFRVHDDRDVVASVHLLNTTPEPLLAEVVYDYFTMPEEALSEELAPFVLDNRLIDVPAMQTETTTAECGVWDGHIVSLMPHTHEFATRFAVETVTLEGERTLIYEEEGFDLESDIAVFDDAVSLEGVHDLSFSCTYDNTKTEPLVYGLGEQEMCILFGYMYPPGEQFAGQQVDPDEGCTTVKVGIFQ